ncbi:glycine cleavage system protein GcvH [Virgibacillus sp. W0181]|uniref:glycine cleavage system protein GcvH n=1 Tax=Virgibacillus sp. W0181 TaxID=3391581 RepID=UPI003F450A06
MVLDDLLYTSEHEWIKKEGNQVRIGITDFAQEDLGEIAFIELPDVGEKIESQEPFGSLESDKTVSELYAPITGTIIEINETLDSDPKLINESPYEKAWMIIVEPADESELDTLMSAEQYKKHIDK